MQDPNILYADLKKKIVDSIQAIFPVDGKKNVISVTDISVTDVSDNNFREQMNLKAKGGTLASPVYGTVVLTDKATGKVINKNKMKIGMVPRITQRGSYIIDGNEYQVPQQLLLRPGIFHRVKENGELEAFINVKGFQAKILFDPEKAMFLLSYGTNNIQLLPLLVGLGVSEDAMIKAWGKDTYDLMKKNSKSDPTTEIAKLNKASNGRATTDALAANLWLKSWKLDDRVTKKTLQGQTDLSPETLLASSAKLLSINRGKDIQDERDSLEFKSIHSVDDFIKNRFIQNANKIKSKIKTNIDIREDVRQIVSSGLLSDPIHSFFVESSLSNTTEQINPLHMLGETNKVIITGEGGIENDHAITDQARMAHPSQLAFIDPVHTPEKLVGVAQHMAVLAHKEGNDLFTLLWSLKTNKLEKVRVDQVSNSIISFADQFDAKRKPKTPKVSASVHGKIEMVDADKVEYLLYSDKTMFDWATNLSPFLQSNSGNRAAFAGKQLEQALILKHREAPLVQTLMDKDLTFDKNIGENLAIRATEDGVVSKITPDEILVGKKVYSLYDHFPLRSKQYLHHTPTVKVGDKVKKDQLIADLNSNKDGHLALGTNLNTAYVSYKGYTFEDGITITDSGSKQLTSEHMYKEEMDIDGNSILDKKRFAAVYPTTFTAKQMNNLGSDGIVKEGSVVEVGDPLVAHLHKEDYTKEDIVLAAFRKSSVKPFKNRSLLWNEEDKGIVKRVLKKSKTIEIQILTEEPMRVGDKLAGRHGNKGIVVKIIPDNEALHTEDGKRIDVYMDPHGIPGRINPSQNLELAASKIAEHTGKPFVVDNFSGRNYLHEIDDYMIKHNIPDKEYLIDPTNGNKLDSPVQTGKQFILKLDHPVRKKFSARAQDGYSADLTPLQGGGVGGQSIDKLTLYSLLAHGANHNLKEMSTYKSEKSDDFWNAYQSGLPLPPAKVPFVFEKFRAMLAASGVNLQKNGNNLDLIPVTQKTVAEMSHGEISSPYSVRAKDLAPEKGGIFDTPSPDSWMHIELAEPMPMPMYEEAILALSGLRKADLEAILEHKKFVTKSGEVSDKEGISGGLGIKRLLDSLDLDAEVIKLTALAKKSEGSELDKVNRKLKYIKALKSNNLKLSDYMTTKIPVIPTKFRTIIQQKNGSLIIPDVNQLYADIIKVNNQLTAIKDLPDSEKANLRKDLYQGMKALVGTGDALTKKGTRDWKGYIKQIAGSSPKFGFYQHKVISKRQDFTGRSTIIPEPEYGIDEVGIPKDMAWQIYRPHIIRALTRLGYKPLDARNAVEQKTDIARRALENEMKERPAIINRSPSLHKFSIMAFQPKLIDGKAIKINPLVVGGFNADFDGDTMSVHVPVSEEARKEAFQMMPSNNLFNPQSNSLEHKPSKEQVSGLYMLTLPPVSVVPKKVYLTMDALKGDYKALKISVRDVVVVNKVVNTVGRHLVNDMLPVKYRSKDIVLDKKGLGDLLNKVAHDDNKLYGDIVSKLKDLGNAASYSTGLSFGIKDLRLANSAVIKAEFLKMEKSLLAAKDPVKWVQNFAANDMKSSIILQEVHKDLAKKESGLFHLVNSSLAGKKNQVEQMLAGPMFVMDHNGTPVPILIKNSYADGLTASEYWTTMAGVRKGMMDRALETMDTGAFSKEVINSGLHGKITEKDCGTHEGILVSLKDKSVHYLDRFTARGNPGIKENTLVTKELLKKFKGVAIRVRSPLTCKARNQPCAMCFGLNENGKLPSVGDNMGVIAAQSLSEPSVQLGMRTFHSGGAIGAQSISGFDRAKQLIELPKIVTDKAALAENSGTVSKVSVAPQGGHYISVGGAVHYSPMKPTVKDGDKVVRGDRLSEGNVKPQELAELKGTLEAKQYIVNEVVKLYEDAGRTIRRPLVETAIGQVIRHAQITDPGDSDTTIGDYMPVNEIEFQNKSLKDKIKYKEIVKGIGLAPFLSNDFLTRLNFERIPEAIQRGAAQGWKSELHGTHPIPGYAFGAEYGHAPTSGAKMPEKKIELPLLFKKK